MSYTSFDAKADQQLEIELAIATENEGELRRLANIIAEEDEEGGAELLEMANRIKRDRHNEDWAYDESIEN